MEKGEEAKKAIEILNKEGVRFFLYAYSDKQGRMLSNLSPMEVIGIMETYKQYFVGLTNNPNAYRTRFDEEAVDIS